MRIGAPTDEAGIPIGTTVAVVTSDGGTDVLMDVPSTDVVLQTCVSPSGRYAAVLVAPDAVANPYDRYQLPLPERLESRVIEIADGHRGGVAERLRHLVVSGAARSERRRERRTAAGDARRPRGLPARGRSAAARRQS